VVRVTLAAARIHFTGCLTLASGPTQYKQHDGKIKKMKRKTRLLQHHQDHKRGINWYLSAELRSRFLQILRGENNSWRRLEIKFQKLQANSIYMALNVTCFCTEITELLAMKSVQSVSSLSINIWGKNSIIRRFLSLSPPSPPLGSTAQLRPWPPPQSSSIKNG
jgi:hypothetical protein